MSRIQQNRYDQLLRRVADLKGQGSKVSDALTELFPMIDVERVPGELLLLGGTAICAGALNTAGAAGEQARQQLFNPVDSGVIATVSQLVFSTQTAQTIRVATVNVELPTPFDTQVFRDRRRAIVAQPVCVIRSDSTVAQTNAHFQFGVSANTPFILKDENSIAVLPPGTGLEIGTTNDNTVLISTFFWRERLAEPSELNF